MADQDRMARTMRISLRPSGGDASGASADMSTSFYAPNRRQGSRWTAYEKLLESVYDAVLITDVRGRITDFNQRAAQFFLYEGEDLLGISAIDLISGAEPVLLTQIQENLEEHKFTMIEGHCVRRDGTRFPAEVAVNRLDLDPGENLSFFVRDITVRKQAQDALEEAVARLELHDAARSQFVSNVSHELRTPLTSMIYAVNNMLLGVVGNLAEPARRYLERLDRDCRRLLGTVNDILDLRKIESRTLTLAKARVPFSRLVCGSVESLRLQAEEKGIHLSFEGPPRPRFVDCDMHKMERVILNVVGNAVKFTPEGGSIRISVKQDPDDAGTVRLSVCDSGIGIPPEAIDKVTVRYFKVGEQPSGSGLGLAIAKELVELHGGSLQIKSPTPNSDRGTAVYVRLPSVEAPTVLVADDDDDVRDLMVRQIEGQGYRVLTATDGGDALRKCLAGNVDVAILDLILPEMDGTNVILQLKGHKHTMRLPVIVVTGAHVGRAKAEILSSFAIPALAKPWKEEELLDRISGAFFGRAVFGRAVEGSPGSTMV